MLPSHADPSFPTPFQHRSPPSPYGLPPSTALLPSHTLPSFRATNQNLELPSFLRPRFLPLGAAPRQTPSIYPPLLAATDHYQAPSFGISRTHHTYSGFQQSRIRRKGSNPFPTPKKSPPGATPSPCEEPSRDVLDPATLGQMLLPTCARPVTFQAMGPFSPAVQSVARCSSLRRARVHPLRLHGQTAPRWLVPYPRPSFLSPIFRLRIYTRVLPGPISNAENEKSDANAFEQKSETYSHSMTQAMGAVLTYRHELGMNYNFILTDLIVGSCLQTPADVDKLRDIGVKTIFCLQQDPDLEYFGVDIKAIQEYVKECKDIMHYRAEIRDFDAFDLRMRLPIVVGELHNLIEQNGGVTYIHCTAGLGRAPAVALAYMFWVRGHRLTDAHELLLSKRPCFPKVEAIKGATADIITGLAKCNIKLVWDGNDCSSVEVSGLDIGWGQRIPLKFDEAAQAWVLERELPEGKYEYKYIVDGEWTCNEYELLTQPNDDGHVNNYIQVHDDGEKERGLLREHLMSGDFDLSPEQRKTIRDYLELFKVKAT